MLAYVKFIMMSCLVLLRMRNISDSICKGNQNVHYIFCNLFSESLVIYEIALKNMIESDHRWYNNTARVLCMLDNICKSTDNTYKIYNTYCFSTATMVTRTPPCYVLRTLPLLLVYLRLSVSIPYTVADR